MTERSPTKILEFLEGKGKDAKGRSLDEIIDQDDEFWSHQHDFIQWVFPLNERSRAVPNSPVLNEFEIPFIKESALAQASIDRSIERYKVFLRNNKKWHKKYDHNRLRITRVLKCLTLFRDVQAARQFKYWVATEIGDAIDTVNERTKQHWRRI